jgi:hypothetical protein
MTAVHMNFREQGLNTFLGHLQMTLQQKHK